jgi:hypothetical protein
MNTRCLLPLSALLFLTGVWDGSALADDSTGTLDGKDVTLALGRFAADGTQITLDSDGLAHYFSKGRCLCPTNVVATVTLDTTAASALGTSRADVSLVVGNDCSDANASDCTTLGQSLTLTATKTSTSSTLTTSSVFLAVLGSAGCGGLSATSNRLWAIVRVGGARVSNPPSLAIGLGAAVAVAPTSVSAKTADEGLAVSWTPPTDVSGIAGYQVLCSPGAATAAEASYEVCSEALPAATGVFAALDTSFVCSALVRVGQNSVRVSGLENGTPYEVAVIAVGSDGLPSAPSKSSTGTPGPTLGFEDLYRADGGTAVSGCSVGGARGSGRGGGAVLVALLLAWRRRRSLCSWGRLLPLACVSLVAARTAWATWDENLAVTSDEPGQGAESPRTWNVELRFGPYRPEVDTELADRGQAERPYADTFGSSRHLMSQLEIDRHLMHVGGTLAVGLGAGYFKVSAAALGADRKTRTGDTTSLRLIPLSLSLVYRADFIPRHTPIPFVPFVKAGLDCGLWSLGDSSKSGASDGVTLGWHGAVGVAIYLDFVEPEAARALDRDPGVNHVAFFFEWGRYALDGLGVTERLRVGDTTWLGGIMLEL